jgi:hypothetical protein
LGASVGLRIDLGWRREFFDHPEPAYLLVDAFDVSGGRHEVSPLRRLFEFEVIRNHKDQNMLDELAKPEVLNAQTNGLGPGVDMGISSSP